MRLEGEVRWNRMRSRWGAAGIGFLLAATCVWMISMPTSRARAERAEEGTSSREALPLVVVIEPEQRDIKQNILLPGSLEPYERASLHAKISGYLEEIRVDIGDRVQKGDVLARLSIPEMAGQLQRAQAEVPAANARVQKARAEAELAHLTYQRFADLRASEPGAVTQQDVDLAAAQEKVALAQIKLARAEVQSARARVAELESLGDYATIRAPFDGVVVARFADTGALIGAGGMAGAPILEVVRTDELRLVFDVPENLVAQCRRGLKLHFKLDALPGRPYEAEISRLAGALNPETRSMRVEADIDNTAGHFHPGMYARVSINLGEIPGATVLPATTIQGRGASPFVYAVRDGEVERIDVNILKDDGAEVVVGGDLDPETQIIVAGPPLLHEGQQVRVRRNGEAH